MSTQTRCAICDDPVRMEAVSRLLAEGRAATRIVSISRTPSWASIGLTPIAYKTITRHIRHLVQPRPVAAPAPTMTLMETTLAAAEEDLPGAPKGPRDGDLAAVIRDRVREGVAAGEVKLTATHGLTAQALIDRRDEKRKDRELQVNLARALLSGRGKAPVIIDMTDDAETPALSG